MRTVIRKPVLAGVLGMLGGVFLGAGAASADVTSDRAAAILVWPKLLFSSAEDTILSEAGQVIDTTIQLTNTSSEEVRLRCFYVNANAHCANDPARVCGNHADCALSIPSATTSTVGGPGFCQPGWLEIDFEVTLTPHQPLVWNLSNGMPRLPCGVEPCAPGGTADQYFNVGNIPPANEDPFMGELKCIQVGANNEPIDRNDIKGEATIVTINPANGTQTVDARGYNAVGIQAIEGANDGDNTLRLGEEYNGCPSVLILDHFFDDAVEPINGDYVKTHLTLVPCSQEFELQAPFTTTVQLLVYNEFEQRFSASRPIDCFKEYELCSLGTGRDRPFDAPGFDDPNYQSCRRSVFSAFVNGTLTGQTRIRGVDDNSDQHGNGLIGIAEEFHRLAEDEDDITATYSSAAYNLHQVGTRERVDIIKLP
jgi:hypothetical protein